MNRANSSEDSTYIRDGTVTRIELLYRSRPSMNELQAPAYTPTCVVRLVSTSSSPTRLVSAMPPSSST